MFERLMGMSDEVWERHLNPWSGWTRVATLPAFTFIVVSRIWIGWWCVVPVILLVIWTWWNPRAFAKPENTDNWMSKGVLGERIWLKRKTVAIPMHHERMSRILISGTGLGLLPYAWGLYQLDPGGIICGLLILMLGKLWFLDRMVWLYEDTMKVPN